jgi:hypothetical protein
LTRGPGLALRRRPPAMLLQRTAERHDLRLGFNSLSCWHKSCSGASSTSNRSPAPWAFSITPGHSIAGAASLLPAAFAFPSSHRQSRSTIPFRMPLPAVSFPLLARLATDPRVAASPFPCQSWTSNAASFDPSLPCSGAFRPIRSLILSAPRKGLHGALMA